MNFLRLLLQITKFEFVCLFVCFFWLNEVNE